MKNIMVIIDESNSSYDLLIWALENHQDAIDNSKLLIFAKQPHSSFTTPTLHSSSIAYAQFFYPFSPNAELQRLAREKNMKIALGILEKAKRICANHGVKAETFTDVGVPEKLISKIIQERKIDVLVMSDQQTRSLKQCIHNTNCSLLVGKKGLIKA